MSGPKISVYNLTDVVMANIIEDIRRQEKIAVRRVQLLQTEKEYKEKLKVCGKKIKLLKQSVDESREWVTSDELQGNLQKLKILFSNIEHTLDGLPDISGNDVIESRLNKAATAMEELNYQLDVAGTQEAKLQDRLKKTLDDKIIELFNKKATDLHSLTNKDVLKQDETSPFTKKCLQELLNLRNNPYLPMTYQKDVDRALKRMKEADKLHQLKVFCEIELPDTLNKCQNFLSLWQEIGNEYQQLITRYEALCDMNKETERTTFVLSKEAIIKLKALIAVEEQKAEEQAQKVYIQQALGEVMEDMGYSILGRRDMMKRNGKHFKNELYQYSDDTAINVTYDDCGQIAVELGKTSGDDRIPTDTECNYLENQMIAFCNHFKEVEQRLADKGVVVDRRIALAPSSADYAQIINVNDYELIQKPQKNESKVRQKAIKSQIMRYNDSGR